MVGTYTACVTFSCSMVCRQSVASKRGTKTWHPPQAVTPKVALPSARWNIGRGMEVGHVLVVVHAGDDVHRVPHQVVVAEHHALGLARRAAGVEQAGQRVTTGARISDCRCRRELLVGPDARRRRIVVKVEHRLDRRHLAVERIGMRLPWRRRRTARAPRNLRGRTGSPALPAGCSPAP